MDPLQVCMYRAIESGAVTNKDSWNTVKTKNPKEEIVENIASFELSSSSASLLLSFYHPLSSLTDPRPSEDFQEYRITKRENVEENIVREAGEGDGEGSQNGLLKSRFTARQRQQ